MLEFHGDGPFLVVTGDTTEIPFPLDVRDLNQGYIGAFPGAMDADAVKVAALGALFCHRLQNDGNRLIAFAVLAGLDAVDVGLQGIRHPLRRDPGAARPRLVD